MKRNLCTTGDPFFSTRYHYIFSIELSLYFYGVHTSNDINTVKRNPLLQNLLFGVRNSTNNSPTFYNQKQCIFNNFVFVSPKRHYFDTLNPILRNCATTQRFSITARSHYQIYKQKTKYSKFLVKVITKLVAVLSKK